MSTLRTTALQLNDGRGWHGKILLTDGRPSDLERHGFLIQRSSDKPSRLRMVCISTSQQPLKCRLRLLDAKRVPLGQTEFSKSDSYDSTPDVMRPTKRRPAFCNARLTRVEERLGGGPLFYGECTWKIPSCLRSVGYAQLVLEPADRRGQEPTNALIVERPKRNLALGTRLPAIHHGIWLDREWIERRTGLLQRRGQALRMFPNPPDEQATDAMLRMYFILLGGYDVPLTAAEPGKEMDRQLRAHDKYAGLQRERNRKTRHGLASRKRSVTEKSESFARATDDVLANVIARDLMSRGSSWMQQQIRYFTPDSNHRKLLRNVILQSKPVTDAAAALKISLPDAEAMVDRFVLYLILN